MSNMWSADVLLEAETATHLVVDDCDLSFEKFQLWKPFVGCQKNIVITDKYRPKMFLKWGKPTIFISNDPCTWPPSYTDLNMRIIEIKDYLY